jgi:hypothetical protein
MTDLERAEYDDVIRQLMAKCEQLVAENAALKAGLDAHSTLKSIYGDSTQPATVRVKAASASLAVEKPRLEPVPPPLDLVAEPVEPLAEVVRRQRARADRLQAEMRDIVVEPSGFVKVLPRPGGNGSGSDTES